MEASMGRSIQVGHLLVLILSSTLPLAKSLLAIFTKSARSAGLCCKIGMRLVYYLISAKYHVLTTDSSCGKLERQVSWPLFADAFTN